MDEPACALDPIAAAKLEDLIDELRGHYTIVVITHNMVEQGDATEIYVGPQHKTTWGYISGRFG